MVVSCSDEALWDGIAEENAEDLVLDGVGFVFVEGDEDEGVLHEMGVVEQGFEEGPEPLTGDGDGGVVAVGGHVGGDEHPLGELIGLEVFVEEGDVFDVGESFGFGDDGVVENLGVVLADVVVGTVDLVYPVESLVTCVGHIFLVQTPADALVLEQINNG